VLFKLALTQLTLSYNSIDTNCDWIVFIMHTSKVTYTGVQDFNGKIRLSA